MIKASLLTQKPRNDAVDDAQHRREQLGVRREQNTQRDRKRQHPLPDRHARDDLVDQDRGALGHAPRAARRAKPAPLAGKRHQLLVRAVRTAHAQKSVRQNTAFKKSLELIFDKRRQAHAGLHLGVGKEGLQLAHNAGLRCLSYTVNGKRAVQRLLDLGTDGLITDRGGLFSPTVK